MSHEDAFKEYEKVATALLDKCDTLLLSLVTPCKYTTLNQKATDFNSKILEKFCGVNKVQISTNTNFLRGGTLFTRLFRDPIRLSDEGTSVLASNMKRQLFPYSQPKVTKPYSEPRYNSKPYNEPRYNTKPYNDPRYNTKPYNEPRYNTKPYNEPRYNTKPYNEPRYNTKPYNEPRYNTKPYNEPRNNTKPYNGPNYNSGRFQRNGPQYEYRQGFADEMNTTHIASNITAAVLSALNC